MNDVDRYSKIEDAVTGDLIFRSSFQWKIVWVYAGMRSPIGPHDFKLRSVGVLGSKVQEITGERILWDSNIKNTLYLCINE